MGGLQDAVRGHGEPSPQSVHALGTLGLGPFQRDGITRRIDAGVRAPPPADARSRDRQVGADIQGALLVPRQPGGGVETDLAKTAQAVVTLSQGQVFRADSQSSGAIATQAGRGAGIVVQPDAASRETRGLIIIGESQQAGGVQYQLLGIQAGRAIQADVATAVEYQRVGLEGVQLALGQNQATGTVIHLPDTNALGAQRHRGALSEEVAG